jgi:hypothetical protein
LVVILDPECVSRIATDNVPCIFEDAGVYIYMDTSFEFPEILNGPASSSIKEAKDRPNCIYVGE